MQDALITGRIRLKVETKSIFMSYDETPPLVSRTLWEHIDKSVNNDLDFIVTGFLKETKMYAIGYEMTKDVAIACCNGLFQVSYSGSDFLDNTQLQEWIDSDVWNNSVIEIAIEKDIKKGNPKAPLSI